MNGFKEGIPWKEGEFQQILVEILWPVLFGGCYDTKRKVQFPIEPRTLVCTIQCEALLRIGARQGLYYGNSACVLGRKYEFCM